MIKTNQVQDFKLPQKKKKKKKFRILKTTCAASQPSIKNMLIWVLFRNHASLMTLIVEVEKAIKTAKSNLKQTKKNQEIKSINKIFFFNSKVAHSDTPPLTRKRADQSRSSSVSVLLDINILDVIQIYNFNKLYDF